MLISSDLNDVKNLFLTVITLTVLILEDSFDAIQQIGEVTNFNAYI